MHLTNLVEIGASDSLLEVLLSPLLALVGPTEVRIAPADNRVDLRLTVSCLLACGRTGCAATWATGSSSVSG